MFRAQHQALLAEAKAAAANPGSTPATLGAFDEKFDYLLTLAPQRKEAIERLRSYFRKEWATALELDRRLAETSVQLHELLDDARTQASVTADLRSSASTSPFQLLDEMRTEMRATLGSVFGARLDPLAPTLTDGEIARLIGECPVDWRK
jgi:hypothetical protein